MEKSFADKVAEAKQAVSAVSPQQAEAFTDAVFVDPRPAEAIASTTGLIPGAKNVPLSELEAGPLPSVLTDTATHVVTACQGGPMGAIAAHALFKRGFTNVQYIDGGTQGWIDAGFQTQR